MGQEPSGTQHTIDRIGDIFERVQKGSIKVKYDGLV